MSRLVKSVKWQEKGSRSQLRWCGEGWERAQIRKDLPAVRSWSCKFNCSCCSHHTLEYFTQELANTIRLSFLFHHDLTAPLIPQTSYCFFLYKNHFCFLLCSSQNSFFSTVPWCSLLPFFSSSLNFCLSVCWPLRFNNAVGQVHAHTAPLQHTRKHQYIHTHTHRHGTHKNFIEGLWKVRRGGVCGWCDAHIPKQDKCTKLRQSYKKMRHYLKKLALSPELPVSVKDAFLNQLKDDRLLKVSCWCHWSPGKCRYVGGPTWDWPACGGDLNPTPAVTESFVTYKLVGASQCGQIPFGWRVVVWPNRSALFSRLKG